MKLPAALRLAPLLCCALACGPAKENKKMDHAAKLETAVLAGGCFWGMEEILRQTPGVVETNVGYTGGDLENPKYGDVKTGATGHAESIEIKLVLPVIATTIRADRTQIEQIIMNLVVNAQDAIKDKGLITIESASAELDDEFACSHPGSHVGADLRHGSYHEDCPQTETAGHRRRMSGGRRVL